MVPNLPWTRHWSQHCECANMDGAAQDTAGRLVVLGADVGQMSNGSAQFVRKLAKAKAREEPQMFRSRAQQAWTLRWSSILACSAAKSLALSLLERRGGFGADGATPSTSEVIGDARHLCA